MILKRRGQITVFIILGMVVFVVFAFLLKISFEAQKLKFEGEASKIINEVESSQAIQHYIYLCLKQSAEEALITLGKQGGRVYDYQNGSSKLNNTPTYNLEENNSYIEISYGLMSPQLRPNYNGSPYPNVPWYPEDGKYHDFINMSKFYYLGENLMPLLCDSRGPNMYNATYSGYTGASCKMRNFWYWSNASDTFQIQLANYTSYLVRDCIDVEFFKEFIGYKLELGMPNTTVTLGETDVSFKTYFPIDIIFENPSRFLARRVVVTKGVSYSVRLPIRIKRIYDFFLDIIDQERKSLKYDFYNDYMKTSSFKKLNSTKNVVIVEKTSVSDTYDQLLRLIDYGSMIRGVPYSFQILLQNRIPVLDWIRTELPGEPYDIAVMENEWIKIDPKGFDPDEDYHSLNCILNQSGEIYECMEHNYNYSGWAETEDYYFNFSCCVNINLSDCLLDYSDGGCVFRPNSEPHNWTHSAGYQSTSRIAEFQTSKKDVGYHNITVKVCDRAGLCDNQTVRILVYDMIQVIPNITNKYIDIDDDFASIEDPYYLSAKSMSVIFYNQNNLFFKWCDDVDFPGCINTTKTLTVLPYAPYDIENITLPMMVFNTTGSHNINVTITGSQSSGSDEFTIDVLECLPHRSQTASYPFNNFSADDGFEPKYQDHPDPFYGSHLCCGGDPNDTSTWDGIEPDTTVCYNYTSYGAFWSFNDIKFTGIKTSFSPFEFTNYPVKWSYYFSAFGVKTTNANPIRINDAITYPVIPNNPIDPSFRPYNLNKVYGNNDVYKRYFTTHCRGPGPNERGNICDNKPLEIREVTAVGTCDDKIDIDQEEKCSGPSYPEYFKLNSETPQNLGCENYLVGKSFEFYLRTEGVFPLIDPETSDGECKETYKCTDGGGYDDGGSTFLCKGQCSGGSCKYADGYPNKGLNWNWGDTCIDCRCFAKDPDNRATLIDFTYTGFSVNIGSCTTGEIYDCGILGPNHNCSKKLESNVTFTNYFYAKCNDTNGNLAPSGDDICGLYQYLPEDTDNACGTKETCQGGQKLDPDDYEDVCELLDWKFKGPNTKYQPSFVNPGRKCCGDDEGEILGSTSPTFCQGIGCGAFIGCRKTDECYFNNRAYKSNQNLIGSNADVDGDADTDYCFKGAIGDAKWFDCFDDSFCTPATWCNNTPAVWDCFNKLPNLSLCIRDRMCQSGNCNSTHCVP